MKNDAQTAAPPGRSLSREAWASVRRNRLAMVCLWIIIVFVALALYGQAVYTWHWIRDTTPSYQMPSMQEQFLPPSVFRHPFVVTNADGTPAGVGRRLAQGFRNLAHHPMGTDNLGRDVMQRVIQGARIAFLVGIVTSLIAIPLGFILGAIGGYFGGRVDDAVVWLYSTFASMPGLLFILAVSMITGKGLLGIYLGIGLTTWVGLCRLIRGEVMKHKERTYVVAARALGLSHMRIMFRHILPNVFHIVIISFSLRFPAAIGIETVMSFLGIGVQSEPSWGIMIANARLRLWYGMWWEMTFAALGIFITVLAFNLFGAALRDALDPRLRGTTGEGVSD